MIKGSELQARHVGSMMTQRTTSGGCGNEGNLKCNPNTWDEFGGYRDGCCTPEQRCQENEGDCSDDSDCFPGLVCGSRNCPKVDQQINQNSDVVFDVFVLSILNKFWAHV